MTAASGIRRSARRTSNPTPTATSSATSASAVGAIHLAGSSWYSPISRRKCRASSALIVPATTKINPTIQRQTEGTIALSHGILTLPGLQASQSGVHRRLGFDGDRFFQHGVRDDRLGSQLRQQILKEGHANVLGRLPQAR